MPLFTMQYDRFVPVGRRPLADTVVGPQVLAYRGAVEADVTSRTTQILDTLWDRHNRDSRPDGQQAPSMSIGDLICLYPVVDGVHTPTWFVCSSVGFQELPGLPDVELIFDRPWVAVR